MDWESVAKEIGAIRSPGHEVGGTEVGRAAVALMVAPDIWLSAVHHILAIRPGSETALSVLRLVRPRVAIEESWRMLENSPDRASRVRAAMIFKDLAGAADAARVDALLESSDSDMHPCGAVAAARIVESEHLDEATGQRWLRLIRGFADEHLESVVQRLEDALGGDEGTAGR